MYVGRVIVVRFLTAALSALGVCAAIAGSASGQRVLVIRVQSVTILSTVNDVSPKGLSKGDRYIGRDKLINVVPQFGQKAGAVVGTDISTLTLTSRTTGTLTGTASVPGGTILFRGVGHLGVNIPAPIVGGTGAFAGARGTVTAGAGNSPINTYRLSLP
jgi:hypothetical protein